MTKIAILGATGYTAVELIKILLRHPQAEITALTSREDVRPIEQVHPSLSGRLDLSLENLSPQQIAERAECAFSCLPHAASATVVPDLLEKGVKVVDFSADYRLHSHDVFKKWYETEHPDPQRLGTVPYGLPEIFRHKIIGANLVANPGCYPTSVILPLVPLLKEGCIEADDIIIDAKSGVSGAGRKPTLGTIYAECNESIAAYSMGTHRHTPEIEQILALGSGKKTQGLIFTPYLAPMNRGILSTIYCKPAKSATTANRTTNEILDILRGTYQNEPFINIVDHLPATKDVAATNFVHITARLAGERVVIVSAIDNLIKGASGAAVQNFNLMYAYPETTALL